MTSARVQGSGGRRTRFSSTHLEPNRVSHLCALLCGLNFVVMDTREWRVVLLT